MRIGAFFTFAVAAVVLCCGRALALTEYCPAQANIVPIVAPTPESGATYPASAIYAVSFNAATPRTVSGNLTFHTSDGWYELPFISIAIFEQNETWRSHAVDFTRKGFDSGYILVRFPRQLTILSGSVSQAQTTGETALGWDKVGSVPCAVHPDGPLEKAKLDRRAPLVYVGLASPLPSTVPVGATLLVPTPIAVPGEMACSKPFAEASVTEPVAPYYPDNVRDMGLGPTWVVVKVAINASGTVDDAWLWASSGQPSIDNAALKAAKISRYQAARSFCKNAPGLYLFIAEFSPN